MATSKKLTGLALTILALSLGPAATAPAADLHVNALRDAADAAPGDGACEATAGAADCTLRAAIQEANALPGADTIDVPEGVFALGIAGESEDAGATGDLDVLDDLTILGKGARRTILDGAGLDRVLDVPTSPRGVSLRLEDLTVRGGTHGGVRTLSCGRLALQDCTVADNDSPADGGGIYAAGGSVELVRCLVRRDHARLHGGGIRVHGGTLTLVDTDVSGNAAAGGHGGGIDASRSVVTVVGGSVRGNVVAGRSNDAGRRTCWGGGIHVAASDVRITGTLVEGNAAEQGNGLFVASGCVKLEGCRFAGSGEALRNAGGSVSLTTTLIADGRIVGSVGDTAAQCLAVAPETTGL